MHWIDWLVVIIPLIIVTIVGLKTQKYVKGVSDFLTAGRVAGRYVLCVANGEASFGLISLAAYFENYYKTGAAYEFWRAVVTPISLILALTGYCTYRFRETRAMTMGQFMEMRYSRNFRMFAGTLQSISGIINYALFPAVGARFIVYYCGLPAEVDFLGWTFPTFALLMAGFLSLAVFIATMGGQITIMTTDCIQGILSYPMYIVVVFFILSRFSWFGDMGPALMDRSEGMSFLDPFDTNKLRDFNVFFVVVGIFSSIINRMGWSGTQGYRAAARDAHEQKMGDVLGSWRAGFSGMMYVMLSIAAFTFLNSDKFQDGPKGAVACRTELAVKAANDVMRDPDLALVRDEVVGYLQSGEITPKMQELLDETAAIKAAEEAARERIRYKVAENLGEDIEEIVADDEGGVETISPEKRQELRESRVYVARDAIRAVDPAASQTFFTIFEQMRVPMSLRYLLPIGVTGVFCAICIFLMVSTDTTYLHSWGSILVQDIILPIRGKPFTPKQQLRLLRMLVAGVALFAFFFSYFFGQVDYILMFFAITGAIWLGGSGPCIVGGLYWKRGTAAGAWSALISGSSLSVTAIIIQKLWVTKVYPWLFEKDLVDTVAIWLQRASSPFEPIVVWRMNSEKFPINSQEVFAITMLISISLYIIVSLLTCREPFNMDRMLHRGKYHREGTKLELPPLRLRDFWTGAVFTRLLGINNQYTRGDKILAWSVFVWSFGFGFSFCFLTVLLINVIGERWSPEGWSKFFFFRQIIVPTIVGVVSSVWFMIGGFIDLRKLFRALAVKEDNVLDDGRVIGHVSADDVAMVESIEHVKMKEAHDEEAILKQELEDEKKEEEEDHEDKKEDKDK